jgi:hypothetical protein
VQWGRGHCWMKTILWRNGQGKWWKVGESLLLDFHTSKLPDVERTRIAAPHGQAIKELNIKQGNPGFLAHALFEKLFKSSHLFREIIPLHHIIFCGLPLCDPYRDLSSLISQCDKHPKPSDHFHKCPCEKDPVLQPLSPGTWVI